MFQGKCNKAFPPTFVLVTSGAAVLQLFQLCLRMPLPGAALDLSKYRPASFPGEGWMPDIA
jgi:hypothetical protein